MGDSGDRVMVGLDDFDFSNLYDSMQFSGLTKF